MKFGFSRLRVVACMWAAAWYFAILPPPGQAQDFWQQLGRTLQQSQPRPQNRPSGNWIQQVPRYRYGEFEGYDTRVNVPEIINDVIRSMPQPQPQYPTRPQPGYTRVPTSRPQSSVPTRATQSRPPRQVTSAPPKNTPLPKNAPEPKNQKTPANDLNALAASVLGLTGPAETDARQAVEASDAGGMLDVSLEQLINGGLTAAGKDASLASIRNSLNGLIAAGQLRAVRELCAELAPLRHGYRREART